MHQDCFVIPILSDVNQHPLQNTLSAIYLKIVKANSESKVEIKPRKQLRKRKVKAKLESNLETEPESE